ncbi:MAG: ATP-dependent Clp protease adaptor ClpS [Pirellulales bacterium]
MSEQTGTDTVEPLVRPQKKRSTQSERKPKRQPRYHVLLWNDDDHTHAYVIAMLRELFGHSVQQGFKLACEVDNRGKAIVLTTTREHAELKMEQIHAYGKDDLVDSCQGSMSASIEPEC